MMDDTSVRSDAAQKKKVVDLIKRKQQLRYEEEQEIIKREILVFCQDCNEWRLETLVEIQGIEEDFDGRDKLSFMCDRCGKFQQSFRVLK